MVYYCFLSFPLICVSYFLLQFCSNFCRKRRSGSQLDWIQSAIGVVDPLSLSTTIICNCETNYVAISA